MSETAPLIDTKNVAMGPKASDYIMVVLWPLLLALCGIALFAFVLAVPPIDTVTPYGVIALITMLLPLIPLLSALNLVRSGSKTAGNVHFWIVVAVCAIMACLILTNDRVISSDEVDSYCAAHDFSCIKGIDMLTDLTLAALVATVVFGVLSAAFAKSFVKKLDIPPLPINA